MTTHPPLLRLLRGPAVWRISLGESRYYGWRWCLIVGPLWVLVGPSTGKPS